MFIAYLFFAFIVFSFAYVGVSALLAYRQALKSGVRKGFCIKWSNNHRNSLFDKIDDSWSTHPNNPASPAAQLMNSSNSFYNTLNNDIINRNSM
jgi:hypothetical protein